MKYRIKKLFSSSWLWCTVLTLAVIAGVVFEFAPMQFLENRIYDRLAGWRSRNDAGPIVIVTVDEQSVQEIGPRPWPRTRIAQAVRKLTAMKPKVMGIQLLFPGPMPAAGLDVIEATRKQLDEDPFLKRRKGRYRFEQLLDEAANQLAPDNQLIDAVNWSLNTVLPLRFADMEISDSPAALPDWLARHSLESADFKRRTAPVASAGIGLWRGTDPGPLQASSVIATYEELARKSGALGHVNLTFDPDGTVRRCPLLILYRDRLFPAFSLQAAAKYLDSELEDLQIEEDGLTLKNIHIPTDAQFQMLIDFRERRGGFATVPIADVLLDRVDPDLFDNKIVLVGESLPLHGDRLYRTTIYPALSGVEITANIVENLVSGKFLSRPSWAQMLELLVLVYFGLFLIFVIPRVKPRDGALILAIFLITWVGFSVVLFMAFGDWIKVLPAVFLATLGYGVAGFHRFVEEKHGESVELNKMLGQSFQGRGMLDMAFEKYRRCPVEIPAVKELLYNLAQDFERKRMFTKAEAVYAYLLQAGRYRDVPKRIEMLRNLGDSSGGNGKAGASLILDKGALRPTVGRYEILEELGQGAMGTVYLGRDPKINREVAIKTLSFTNVSDDKLEEVKERFLREAEAAGRLSHPNIVTIFDVGEEHDLAYMAMQLLKGRPLADYCQKGALMAVKKVLKVVAEVAEALQYAHTHGVVHRDVKPENIILLDEGQIKVADFGIARVMSTSNTQTGVILGTPNYMSPEQVEGSHVDGRSDLFSLGVVMYELLSGEKPFHGDNMAHLMYNIANGSHVPLPQVAANVPECCVKIVNKLLSKDPDKRYKTAETLIKSLQQCQENL
ncbi:MAG TPA: CHASE2 domain-containing serine/threonine-protein kinase [Desulfobacterales bacterium]